MQTEILRRYMTQTEADALAARLSVAGIACRLRGTDDVNALQMGGAGGKGVSIVVQAEQVEAAKELLGPSSECDDDVCCTPPRD